MLVYNMVRTPGEIRELIVTIVLNGMFNIHGNES